MVKQHGEVDRTLEKSFGFLFSTSEDDELSVFIPSICEGLQLPWSVVYSAHPKIPKILVISHTIFAPDNTA